MSLQSWWHAHFASKTDRKIEAKRVAVHSYVNDVTGKMLHAGTEFEEEKRRFLRSSQRYLSEMESVAARIAQATSASKRGYKP